MFAHRATAGRCAGQPRAPAARRPPWRGTASTGRARASSRSPRPPARKASAGAIDRETVRSRSWGTSAARVTTMNRVCTGSRRSARSSRIDFERSTSSAASCRAVPASGTSAARAAAPEPIARGVWHSSSRRAWPVGAVSTTMKSSRPARPRPKACRTARRCRAAPDSSSRADPPKVHGHALSAASDSRRAGCRGDSSSAIRTSSRRAASAAAASSSRTSRFAGPRGRFGVNGAARLEHVPREWAGSVESSSTRRAVGAGETSAVAAATVVFPTPPLPPKNSSFAPRRADGIPAAIVWLMPAGSGHVRGLTRLRVEGLSKLCPVPLNNRALSP